MKKTIAVLSGKAGAGKDTFAAMLGGAWERISFADEVKKVTSELVELHLDFFHDVDKKDRVMLIGGKMQTPRDLLISVGMYYRGIDPNYWTNRAVGKIRASDSEYFVITDWRFPNEIEAIREAFAPDLSSYALECEALDEERESMDQEELECDLRSYPTKPAATAVVHSVRIVGSDHLGSSHESECALDSYYFDSTIFNRSDLVTLENKARILRAMLGEAEAINFLCEEYYPKISNLVRKHTKSPSNYWDATQEAILSVVSQLKKYNFGCSLWTFLYTVVYFSVQNDRRKRLTYSNTFVLENSYGGSIGIGDIEGGSAAKKSSPLIRASLNEAVSTLSELDQKLFALRHDGWKHKEIGKELGITENYSRRRLFSIHKKLRGLLQEVYSDLIE